MNRFFSALMLTSCMTPDDIPEARHLPGTVGACVESCQSLPECSWASEPCFPARSRCERKCRTGCSNLLGCH